MVIVDIFKAMQAGKEIKDPAKWKNYQNIGNQFTVLLTFLVTVLRILGVDIGLTDEQLVTAGAALGILFGIANSVLTAITTKKISITGKVNNE